MVSLLRFTGGPRAGLSRWKGLRHLADMLYVSRVEGYIELAGLTNKPTVLKTEPHAFLETVTLCLLHSFDVIRCSPVVTL